MGEPVTARQIIELLRHRHPVPEWASFIELPSNTGGIGRYLDFYAINTWKSKRFLKIAYEIKVSRADFARELSAPQKRAFAESVADECWFAMPVGLVQADEVPEGWGLIELVSNGLRVKKRAMQRKVEQLSMAFAVSIARRSSDPPPELPPAIWLKAGRELTDQELLQVATADLEIYARSQRQAAVEEFKRSSDDLAKLNRLKTVIARRIGSQYADDPDKLTEWIDHHKEGEKSLPFRLKAHLKVLKLAIEDLIKESEQ